MVTVRRLRSLYEKAREHSVARLLARGAGATFVIRLAGYALAFCASILLARVLGSAGYGEYAYVLAWLNVAFLLGKLGFDHTILRFVAGYEKTEQWSLLKGVLRRGNQLSALASTVVAGAAGIALWLFAPHGDALVQTAWIACLVLPFFVLANIRQATLSALLRPARGQLPELVLRPLVLIGLVVTFGLFIDNVSSTQAMLSYLGATLCSFGLGAFWLSRALPAAVHRVEPAYRTREWISVAVPLMLISGSQMIMAQTDIIMLGSIASTQAAGIYTVATRIAMVLLLGLTAVSAILSPLVAGLHAKGEHNDVQAALRFSTLALLVFTLPLLAVLLVLGEHVLAIFGQEFATGALALRILLVANAANAISGPVGLLLTMTGHHRITLVVLSVSALLNVGLNALLIPIWGLEGAAITTAFTTMGWNLVMIVLAFKLLDLRASILSLSRWRQ